MIRYITKSAVCWNPNAQYSKCIKKELWSSIGLLGYWNIGPKILIWGPGLLGLE